MSLPKIPAGLYIAAQGYGFGGAAGARRTDIASGRGRYGLNYYGGTSQFAITIVLTCGQMHPWTLFYNRKIALGTLPFEMELDSGMGVMPHECNILPDSYQASLNSGIWSVSFNVEARASAYDMDQAVVDLELDYWDSTGGPLGPMLDRLTIFANQDVLILNRVRDPDIYQRLDGTGFLDGLGFLSGVK
ncbi:hypothetical protein [Pseudomonas sp.]|uniref:hypothetical protein n=1 Tax=Pseudomonas sp. TaxID=306 RepID=UPI00258E6952|nr:hypothetical protein [Pseudomonas sp.]